MEKIETEFEFYGFTLEELKKEYERLFRLHCKRMVEKFTNDIIDAAQKEFTVETANKIKSLADNALNLIKPETVKLLSKINVLVDKHFTIPPSLPLGENSLQNTPEMDDYERKCKKDIAEREMTYKQQAIMIKHLTKEIELYDSNVMEEADIDMSLCDLFDANFGESNFSVDMINSVAEILNEIEMKSTQE